MSQFSLWLMVGILVILVCTTPISRAAVIDARSNSATLPTPLTVAAMIGLGRFSSLSMEEMPDAEAADGTFYFVRDLEVEAVHSDGSPVLVVRVTKPVIALAATGEDLYVQTGLIISDYALPAAHLRRSWTIVHDLSPTSAGLFVQAGALWSWTDSATDQSGFEYATLREITTGSSAIRVIDRDAFPQDMAVDDSGLYYETEIGAHGYLAHLSPNGTRVLSRPTSDVDAPIALSSGSVFAFTERGSGVPYLDRFSPATLAKLSSRRLPGDLVPFGVGSAIGLLTIESACTETSCLDKGVVRIDPLSGAITGTISLPGVEVLVGGADPAALVVRRGQGSLVRLQ